MPFYIFDLMNLDSQIFYLGNHFKFLMIICILSSCNKPNQLKTINVSDFKAFVSETDYVTDAEKYGWSIVQTTIYNFYTQEGATWIIPNSIDTVDLFMPVTQVSFNDAMAYCKWSNTRLPSYKEYWQIAKNDNRRINHSSSEIEATSQVNIIGNVWDITTTENVLGEVRLAGGSYLCNTKTCNGTDPDRKLFVDKTTGNVHIGFSVIIDN